MPKHRKKDPKYINLNFGPAALLREEIDAFLAGCEDRPEIVTEYRQSANWLARLVCHPEDMVGDCWFAGFYAAHPRFTLEFMLAMRRALARKSTAEKWLHTFDAMATPHSKTDGAVKAALHTRGVRITSRELGTARATMRARSALQRKRKHL
jgi:hypothetical protein